jgi:hypothetical protein
VSSRTSRPFSQSRSIGDEDGTASPAHQIEEERPATLVEVEIERADQNAAELL